MRRLLTSALASLAGLAGLFAIGASGPAAAGSAAEIDALSTQALNDCYRKFSACQALGEQAAGILIFPSITKGGFIVGGEYGEGALRERGATTAYYSAASASIGLQAGVQSRSQIIMFLTPQSLERFRISDGWEAGVDAEVTVVTTGASGKVTTIDAQRPVVGFIFGESGLMGGLSFEGTKISRIIP